MNEAHKRAIKTAIRNAEDNLYRAKLQKIADPTWVSGNGKAIDDLIAAYRDQLEQLKETP